MFQDMRVVALGVAVLLAGAAMLSVSAAFTDFSAMGGSAYEERSPMGVEYFARKWEDKCEVMWDGDRCAARPTGKCSGNLSWTPCGPGITPNNTITTCYAPKCEALIFVTPETTTSIADLLGFLVLGATLVLTGPILVLSALSCASKLIPNTLLRSLAAVCLFMGVAASAGMSGWILGDSMGVRNAKLDMKAEKVENCTVVTRPVTAWDVAVQDYGHVDVRTESCNVVRYWGDKNSHSNATFNIGDTFQCHVKPDCTEVQAVETLEDISFAPLAWAVTSFALAGFVGFVGFLMMWHVSLAQNIHVASYVLQHGYRPRAPEAPEVVTEEYKQWDIEAGELEGCPVPDHMQCPISLLLMTDPVQCACEGSPHTFERVCLERCINKKAECPLSRHPMTLEDITSDEELRKEVHAHIEEWKREQQENNNNGSDAGGEEAVEEGEGVPNPSPAEHDDDASSTEGREEVVIPMAQNNPLMVLSDDTSEMEPAEDEEEGVAVGIHDLPSFGSPPEVEDDLDSDPWMHDSEASQKHLSSPRSI